MSSTSTSKIRLVWSTPAFWIPHACQLFAHLILEKATPEVRAKVVQDHVGKHFRRCMVSDQAGVVILILQPLMTVQMVTLRYFSEQDRWQCHNSEPVSSDESSFENFDPFNGFEFVDP